jgi:hypothetical protein
MPLVARNKITTIKETEYLLARVHSMEKLKKVRKIIHNNLVLSGQAVGAQDQDHHNQGDRVLTGQGSLHGEARKGRKYSNYLLVKIKRSIVGM